jgi:glycine/D-amino acid oxidase-like deaminating enzyme/nitrite reductase/ring-hydroxylating ferredoxin subunit
MNSKYNSFRIVYNQSGGWDLLEDNSKKILGHFETKREAIKVGKQKCNEQNSSLLIANKPKARSIKAKCHFTREKESSGTTQSPWLMENPLEFSPLNNNDKTEICIVGAGIAGLSIAYQLCSLGQKVIVIDAGVVGSGETGRTTAHLTNAFDDRYYNLAHIHNIHLVADSHTQAINNIEQIIKKENIDCDFIRLNGYLFLGQHDSQSTLEKELKYAQEAGLSEVSLIKALKIKGFPERAVLRFPNQAQFHPIAYLKGLAKSIVNQGGKIYTHTPVTEIKTNKIIKIKTENQHIIEANKVVIATNAPIYDNSYSFAKQTSNRSYVLGALISKGSVEPALYWDTEEPYHYIRTQPWNDKEDLLIIGGEDHRTGKNPQNALEPFYNLERWSRTIFPQITEIKFKWSGQIQEPIDYLAYIGQLSDDDKNVYIATGDSGNGMTHGAIAGMLISDLIMKKTNPWEQLYSPKRSAFKKIKNLLSHNFKSGFSYCGYLIPGEFKSIEAMQKGEGSIINKGFHKIAVFKNEKGEVCQNAPVCTHMGAPLQWNPIEKSWDCPAHGSRFAPCGQVLQGPATSPLKTKK